MPHSSGAFCQGFLVATSACPLSWPLVGCSGASLALQLVTIPAKHSNTQTSGHSLDTGLYTVVSKYNGSDAAVSGGEHMTSRHGGQSP